MAPPHRFYGYIWSISLRSPFSPLRRRPPAPPHDHPGRRWTPLDDLGIAW